MSKSTRDNNLGGSNSSDDNTANNEEKLSSSEDAGSDLGSEYSEEADSDSGSEYSDSGSESDISDSESTYSDAYEDFLLQDIIDAPLSENEDFINAYMELNDLLGKLKDKVASDPNLYAVVMDIDRKLAQIISRIDNTLDLESYDRSPYIDEISDAIREELLIKTLSSLILITDKIKKQLNASDMDINQLAIEMDKQADNLTEKLHTITSPARKANLAPDKRDEVEQVSPPPRIVSIEPLVEEMAREEKISTNAKGKEKDAATNHSEDKQADTKVKQAEVKQAGTEAKHEGVKPADTEAEKDVPAIVQQMQLDFILFVQEILEEMAKDPSAIDRYVSERHAISSLSSWPGINEISQFFDEAGNLNIAELKKHGYKLNEQVEVLMQSKVSHLSDRELLMLNAIFSEASNRLQKKYEEEVIQVIGKVASGDDAALALYDKMKKVLAADYYKQVQGLPFLKRGENKKTSFLVDREFIKALEAKKAPLVKMLDNLLDKFIGHLEAHHEESWAYHARKIRKHVENKGVSTSPERKMLAMIDLINEFSRNKTDLQAGKISFYQALENLKTAAKELENAFNKGKTSLAKYIKPNKVADAAKNLYKDIKEQLSLVGKNKPPAPTESVAPSPSESSSPRASSSSTSSPSSPRSPSPPQEGASRPASLASSPTLFSRNADRHREQLRNLLPKEGLLGQLQQLMPGYEFDEKHFHLTGKEAEALLADKSNGNYVVRLNRQNPSEIVLTYKENDRINHVLFELDNEKGLFHAKGEKDRPTSGLQHVLNNLIEMQESIKPSGP